MVEPLVLIGRSSLTDAGAGILPHWVVASAEGLILLRRCVPWPRLFYDAERVWSFPHVYSMVRAASGTGSLNNNPQFCCNIPDQGRRQDDSQEQFISSIRGFADGNDLLVSPLRRDKQGMLQLFLITTRVIDRHSESLTARA